MLETKFENIMLQHVEIFKTIPEDDIDMLILLLNKVLNTGNIIGLGAGRMGYSLRSFIMRLSHVGFEAFMIGDTTLPRVTKSDLVIVNSSTGNTPSIALYAEQAKVAGAKIALITSTKESRISKLSDLTVEYSVIDNHQLMKTVHEQFSLLFFDYIVHRLVVEGKMDVQTIERNHSILE